MSEAAAALRVPYDVLEHVAVFADQASLLALCHVSHEVSSLATRQLYRYIVFTPRNGHAAVKFFELIARNQSLGKLVGSLSIQVASHLPRASHRTFVAALRLMPMLRHLYCRNLEDVIQLDVMCLDAIRGLTRLDSFSLFAPYISSSGLTRILDALPPLKRLHFDRNDTPTATRFPPLQRLLLRSSATLVSLSLINSTFDLDMFLAETGSGVIWANLTCLTVYDISARFPAHSFPNLEQLNIYNTVESRNIDPIEEALFGTNPVLFPKLTRLSTVAVGRKFVVVEKRSIRHLATALEHRSSFPPLMSLFSLSVLRSLQWTWTRYPSASMLRPLPEILQQCTNLMYLGIDTREDPHECLSKVQVSAVVDALNNVLRKELLALLHYVSVRTASAAQASKKLDTLQPMITPLFVGFVGLRCFQLSMAEGVEVWIRSSSPSEGNISDEPIITRDANYRLPMTFDEVVARVELECV